MHTTETTATSHEVDETKGFWVRRTLAPVGIAAGLALALALSACGTDQATKRTAVDASTTSPSAVAGEVTGAAVSDDTSATDGGGQSSSSGTVSTGGNSSTETAGASQAAPTIDSFYAPDSVDCHNGGVQYFTVSWESSNATKATISIDGPGVYAEYPADGEASINFTCTPGETQTVLLTVYGHNGATATHTVTLAGRNIQGDEPEDEFVDVRSTAKTQGGSTGTGPASEHDCDVYAQQIDGYMNEAVETLDSGDVSGAIDTTEKADQVENEGLSAGCFFVYPV